VPDPGETLVKLTFVNNRDESKRGGRRTILRPRAAAGDNRPIRLNVLSQVFPRRVQQSVSDHRRRESEWFLKCRLSGEAEEEKPRPSSQDSPHQGTLRVHIRGHSLAIGTETHRI